MSRTAREVILADVAELNPRVAASISAGERVAFVPMSAVDAEATRVTEDDTRAYAEVCKGYTPFEDRDVLVAKITPCFENGKIAQAHLNRRYGFGSSEFHVVRPHLNRLDGRYLVHFLRQAHVREQGVRRMTGSAGQRRVPAHFLAGLRIPLPPLTEQRRIAAILDKADELRARRRAAIAKLDTLTQAIFLDMFGDPATNSKGWPTMQLGATLTTPLRNGLSPSKAGTIRSRVLTLSAVTGTSFDAASIKSSLFQSVPPNAQTVDERDFLICRGNGNVALVGRGQYPNRSMPDVAFPDTVIAARVNPDKLAPAFLQQVWSSSLVRTQVEALARTTNGTYKVNQEMVSGIVLVLPPVRLQRRFAQHIAALGTAKVASQRFLASLEALFVSLQHRAFHGGL